MSIHGVSTNTTYESKRINKADSVTSVKKVNSETNSLPSDKYEESSRSLTKASYKKDTNIINQLKAESAKREARLRDLVEKTLLKQGQSLGDSNMYELLREGKLNVDEATSKEAKAEISEDGYWGVNQTSDRLVSFAKALTGGDKEKADEMIEAVKKGLEQAKKVWGGELPDICNKTIEVTLTKLEEWKNQETETGKKN